MIEFKHEKNFKKEKVISNYIRRFCLFAVSFFIAVFYSCNYYIYPVHADETEVKPYYWLNSCTVHLGLDTNIRFLSTDPSIKVLFSTTDNDGLNGIRITLYKVFKSDEDYNTWLANVSVIQNTATNFNTSTYGQNLEFTHQDSFSYSQLGQQYSETYVYWTYYENNFGYVWSHSGEQTWVFGDSSGYSYGNVAMQIGLVEHGVKKGYFRGSNSVSTNATTYGTLNRRWKPFKKSSQSEVPTDLRTTQSVDTNNVKLNINLHPEDVWNTYQVNRVTATQVNEIDNYVMPNATTVNGDVIEEQNLNYNDMSSDTQYNVTNVNNYYGVPSEENNNSENQGGNVGTSGIVITNSPIQQQQQQQQSIETGAAQATITVQPNSVVINNTNNLTQEQWNELNQIINGNKDEETHNSIQGAVSDMSSLNELAPSLVKLIDAYVLPFFPWYSKAIFGLILSIMAVAILFRIIHLFI